MRALLPGSTRMGYKSTMWQMDLLFHSLRDGWRLGKQHCFALLGASFTYFAVAYGPLVMDRIFVLSDMAGFLLGLGCGLLSVILDIGLMGIAMDVQAGRPIRYERIFRFSHYLLPLLGLSAAVGIPVLAVALLSFKLPALAMYPALAFIGGSLAYFGTRFSLLVCVLAEKETGLFAGLRESWRLTQRHFLPLALLLFGQWLVGIAGLLCLGVGYLLAVPVVMFSMLSAYRRLQGARDSSVATTET